MYFMNVNLLILFRGFKKNKYYVYQCYTMKVIVIIPKGTEYEFMIIQPFYVGHLKKQVIYKYNCD